MAVILECRDPATNPTCWAFTGGLAFMLMNEQKHHNVGDIFPGLDVEMERVKLTYQSHYGEWMTYLKPCQLGFTDVQNIRAALFKMLDKDYEGSYW